MEISQKLLGLMFTLSVLTGAGLGLMWNGLHLVRALVNPGARSGASASKMKHRDAPAGRTAVPFPARLGGWIRQALLIGLDVLFGVLCGTAVVLLLYYTNDGQFRLLCVLGTIGGFFVWHHTLGLLFDRLTDALVLLLRRLLKAVVRQLLRPVKRMTRAWSIHHEKRAAARKARRSKAERGQPRQIQEQGKAVDEYA